MDYIGKWKTLNPFRVLKGLDSSFSTGLASLIFNSPAAIHV